MVMQKSANEKWSLESLDIGTAFLQGFKFSELEKIGMKRQPCAFACPSGVLSMLASLDPVKWSIAASKPELHAFELCKAAYGLKDAPLLWYVMINSFLTCIGFKAMKHDPCVYSYVADDKIVALLSLHVDDTLVTGTSDMLLWLKLELEAKFGKIKREVDHFKHFGVDVFRCSKTGHVYASQLDYLAQLSPIVLERKRGDGRTIDTPANAIEITAFRSLVSAIAWLGVTYPPAGAAASLYQGYLPFPNIGHIVHVNTCLEHFHAQYAPLVFRHGITDPVLVIVADSSLGNNARYSQGGYFIFYAQRSDTYVCGECSMMSYKSSKSKRVASSTFHAETLALTGGMEEAVHIQTWWWEIEHPTMSTFDILGTDPSLHLEMIGITDCQDLLEVLVKPTAPILGNKAMSLYIYALRELRESGYVSAWLWCDTRDNIANALTKLNDDGTLPIEPVTSFLRNGAWEPAYPYRWQHTLTDPAMLKLTLLPSPPASTSKASTTIPTQQFA
jgi:hypothetical protein